MPFTCYVAFSLCLSFPFSGKVKIVQIRQLPEKEAQMAFNKHKDTPPLILKSEPPGGPFDLSDW